MPKCKVIFTRALIIDIDVTHPQFSETCGSLPIELRKIPLLTEREKVYIIFLNVL